MLKSFVQTYGRRWLTRLQKNRGWFSVVNIETFAYCNRQCEFCLNHERFPARDKGVMSEAIYCKIIDELGAMRFAGRISPHFYGEPLLDKRLPQLIAYTRRVCPWALIRVNSNGDLLTEEKLLELLASGMDRIIVTNYDDADNEVVAALARRFPEKVRYRRKNELWLANRAGKLRIPGAEKETCPCRRPMERLVVNWKGDVVLCCNDYYGAHVFGNLSQSSILDIWERPAFREMRERLAVPGGRCSVDICRGCDQQ